MKEFVVYYTLENDIKKEIIIKELKVEKEEVLQEIIEKIIQRKYFIAKGDQEDYCINTSLIRYIRVLHNKQLSNCQTHQ
ncbi:hypothetical protein [Heyndrickxia acidicola]|uniref:Uncharacterized protein n=1 Tax=Heyndrickxia acidicola TaxID=209389 RepID=A0ABU6MH05_9BACI|nr:hypothetical protein [Heyndrickxia acidicola]MED1203780.1 hypothetical protein [Heyndrickxia acidicola]